MADYFNAEKVLPPELLSAVLKHIPAASRSGVVLYFSENYYAMRNSEIIALFRIYQADPQFGSNLEIYEALSEQYGLTVRRICRIVQGHRDPEFRRGQGIRRRTGLRVERSQRRMHVSVHDC